MDNKKKQIVKISVFITSIFVIFLSVTYAFINLTLEGTRRQVITAGNISLELFEDENNLTIEDAMPMYDEVGMIQTPFTFRLINETPMATNYKVMLVDITATDANKLDTNVVKYGLTKDGASESKMISELTNGVIDSGTIDGSDTIEYALRLWIDSSVTDNSQISGKTLSYRIDVEANQDIEYTTATVASELVDFSTTGENCKTYNDGVDTFLVGQCSNNYVWYSGKLWRVVLKNNETGAVKMVTANGVTSIIYNESGNSAFENSYIDQWVSQEFLPTLHDYEDYLVVDSVWDATINASNAPTRPAGTTTVTRTVGLLNSYEFYVTYANSDGLATSLTTYLNNGNYYFLMTPYDSSTPRFIYNGFAGSYRSDSTQGVRPTINLLSTIQISSGTGTETDPYILEGDTQQTTNGTTLLNTRYSGEYITFNNELYRIVGVENGLVKITAVDKPSALTSNAFHSDNTTTNFANAQIKTDLENYYQGLDVATKAMIQENTTWYLGTVGDGASYKASICATVDTATSTSACEKTTTTTTASIALPRVGEMFTSQITKGTSARFFTLTPFSTSEIRFSYERSNIFRTRATYTYGARPSMYLKSNVVIATDNAGNGSYEKPYSIELGA